MAARHLAVFSHEQTDPAWLVPCYTLLLYLEKWISPLMTEHSKVSVDDPLKAYII